MSTFWDEFKDLFKTQSQKDEERRQEISDALRAEKEVTAKLEELDREYRDSLPVEEEPDLDALFPVDSGYEKVDYTPATDEELVHLAESEINSKKSGDILDLDSAYRKAVDAVGEKTETAEKKRTDTLNDLTAVYEQLRKDAENKATERGLARSSILSSAVGDLADAEASDTAATEKEYAEQIASLDAELVRLSSERESALGQMELEYAAELEGRIAELKAERDAEAKKYAEYNNKIAEKDREYALEREENIADYLEEKEKERQEKEEELREQEAKYGYTGEKQQNYAKRYDIAYEFYSSLSPDIAAAALEASPNMRYYLGNYYDKLLDTLSEKGKKVYF